MIALLAILVGVHFVIMTVIGNMKDYGEGEKSIPELLGITSPAFACLYLLLAVAQAFLFEMLLHSEYSVTITTAVTVSLFIVYERSVNSSPTEWIVIYELVSVFAFCMVLLPYLGGGSVLLMLIATVVWGLSWQKLVYGSFLYFP